MNMIALVTDHCPWAWELELKHSEAWRLLNSVVANRLLGVPDRVVDVLRETARQAFLDYANAEREVFETYETALREVHARDLFTHGRN